MCPLTIATTSERIAALVYPLLWLQRQLERMPFMENCTTSLRILAQTLQVHCRQVESWWKDVQTEETIEPDPSISKPERLASAGRSLPIQHSAASIASVHSASQLTNFQHAASLGTRPSRLQDEPSKSVSLMGNYTDDYQASY